MQVNIQVLSEIGGLKRWQSAVFAKGKKLNSLVDRKFKKFHLSEYQLAKTIGVSRKSIRQWRGKNGKAPVLMPLLKLLKFSRNEWLSIDVVKMYQSNKWVKIPTKITPMLSELIGRHVGDGSITKTTNSIKLTTAEKRFAILHAKEFKQIFGVEPEIKKGNGNYWDVVINSKPLCVLLNKIFEQPIGKKARTAHEPKIIAKSGRQNEILFLRGISDTDGSIWRTRSGALAFEIGSTSKTLIRDCERILNCLGFSTHVIFQKEKNFFRVKIPDNEVLRLKVKMGFKNSKKLSFFQQPYNR